ncbi:ankyrin repeat domain-containing protein 31-like [Mytilus trossulus]|uniref:ankyrin repeat domain-containing protein 31-like n=1 Tax=Mytilus trossulus TaxID=6551 RepID=UPI0030054AA4
MSTPPLSPREGYNDISPSVASFATFRSAVTEHFPHVQAPDPQDMFNGLKYPPLHLLINKGFIKPGRNILTANAKGKEFKSSLTEDGNIESLGGELFQTPVKWLAAILGKPVPDVKKSQAYKQVHYRGMSLISILKEPTLVLHDEVEGALHELYPNSSVWQHNMT